MEGAKESKWGWLKKLLGLQPTLIPLVSARIVADAEYRYFLSLSRHHSQVPPFEFVRLLLHYYARVLFLFNPADTQMIESAKELMEMMRAIFRRRVDPDCDVLQRGGIDQAMTLVKSETQEKRREITTTLYYIRRGELYLKTDIPKNATTQHILYSVPALLQSILPELDARSVNVLNYAVAKMHEAYQAGKSFSELGNMSAIPTETFDSAAKLFGQPPSPE